MIKRQEMPYLKKRTIIVKLMCTPHKSFSILQQKRNMLFFSCTTTLCFTRLKVVQVYITCIGFSNCSFLLLGKEHMACIIGWSLYAALDKKRKVKLPFFSHEIMQNFGFRLPGHTLMIFLQQLVTSTLFIDQSTCVRC